jgi:hypothetical protein
MVNIRSLASALGALAAIFLGGSANGAAPDIEVGAATKVVNYVYGKPESTNQARLVESWPECVPQRNRRHAAS